jgi:hypothetical protein
MEERRAKAREAERSARGHRASLGELSLDR